MSALRTKCISTKVTEEEYRRLEVLAGERRLSEWARSQLLKAASTPTDHILLAEVVALRMILLNLHFALASGEPLTAEMMHGLIERADEEKIRRAHECLASLVPGTDP